MAKIVCNEEVFKQFADDASKKAYRTTWMASGTSPLKMDHPEKKT